jgi:HSP90 family molecular chaperone
LTIQHISKISKQVEIIKFHAEIYQLMPLIINAFYEKKEIFSEDSSQTARMHVIKLYESLKNVDVLGE